jgi:hypothetical protein
VHIENLLFILLIAMAALLRLLASKAGEAKKMPQKPEQGSTSTFQPREPISRAPVQTDEQRIREFLEALGQPTTSRPPPPVLPRTNIPPRPLAPVQPPHGPFSFPRGSLTPEERDKRHVILHKTSPPPSPVFEIQERPVQVEPPGDVKSPPATYAIDTRPKTEVARTEKDIATFLRSSAGMRKAIILREIFGPPRGLQPVDLIGSA